MKKVTQITKENGETVSTTTKLYLLGLLVYVSKETIQSF